MAQRSPDRPRLNARNGLTTFAVTRRIPVEFRDLTTAEFFRGSRRIERTTSHGNLLGRSSMPAELCDSFNTELCRSQRSFFNMDVSVFPRSGFSHSHRNSAVVAGFRKRFPPIWELEWSFVLYCANSPASRILNSTVYGTTDESCTMPHPEQSNVPDNLNRPRENPSE